MLAENTGSEFERLGMDDLRQNVTYADVRLDITAMLVVDHEDFRIHQTPFHIWKAIPSLQRTFCG
jgi:hypothetical protein